MDLIKKIIEKTGKDEGEIWELIEKKRKEMDYLISEEGAAHIIASELGMNSKPTFKVKNLQDKLSGVTITLKVVQVSPIHEFEKGNKKGKVRNLVCEDETGRVNVSLWDRRADMSLEKGDTLQITGGYVKGFSEGLEIRAGNKSTVDVESQESPPAKNLASVKEGDIVNVRAAITRVFDRETFFDSPEGKQLMFSGMIDDGTASIRAIFFRSAAESLVGIPRKKAIEIVKMSGREDLLKKVPLLVELYFSGKIKRNDMMDSNEMIVNYVLKIDPGEEVDRLIDDMLGAN